MNGFIKFFALIALLGGGLWYYKEKIQPMAPAAMHRDVHQVEEEKKPDDTKPIHQGDVKADHASELDMSNNTQQEEKTLHVYSSRKEILLRDIFDRFTKETGIRIEYIYDEPTKLLVRMEQEKEHTEADLYLTADLANLELAKSQGLLQPVTSSVLDTIPAEMRDPENQWFGLTKRVRPIYYNTQKVNPSELSSYEALADEKWKGKLLMTSSSSAYNQSLVASLIVAHGDEFTENWVKGIVANFARTPQGGDTELLKALSAGEGDIAVANSYYYFRLKGSKNEQDQEIAKKIGIFFPNQSDRGVHVNISGGGVTKYAKSKGEAIRLLEFLVSPEAQALYANGNFEYPILEHKIALAPVVAEAGVFKEDIEGLKNLSKHYEEAFKITDRAGWR